MKKYAVIYRSVLMENLQYVMNVVLGFISYFVFIFVFIQLWNYMYETPGELIAGYTREQMIWYVMITETIWFGAHSMTLTRQASSDIRGGNIAYMINKPYHYPLYLLTKYTGEWSIHLPVQAALSAVMGIALVGGIEGFRALTFLAVLPVVVLGITIHGVLKLCISLLSFWVEDSNPFQWIYDKLLLLVGTIFPIEIFPAALQPFFKLTPIYAVCYGPAKLLVDFSAEKYFEILLIQILYLTAGCGFLFFLYERGARRLYVNGG